MSFDLKIPRNDGTSLDLVLSAGECLFVLGANGTGKSSLMLHLYKIHRSNARRISAHRQTWFNSNAVTLSAIERRNAEQNIFHADSSAEARWTDTYSAHRSSIAVFDLVDAENVRARNIAQAVDGQNLVLAQDLSKRTAPVKVINDLLRLSNIPIEIDVRQSEQVVARKAGSVPYSIADLSDGERNALLLAANVLTLKDGTLIIVDEPERHLHRSIISSLLTHLFARRPDCAFIVSTHDVSLALDNPSSHTVLTRGCTFAGSAATSWDVDLVPTESDIEDSLKKEILGARRKILFVEGSGQSLDKLAYNLLFPNVSVIAKSTCREVERAVSSLRDSASFHWLHPFGIVDNDRRTEVDIERLRTKGVYAVKMYSIESIYYHPEIQNRVTFRQAAVTGGDASVLLANAKVAAIRAVAPHAQRLAERAVEKVVREKVFHALPGREEIAAAAPVTVSIDVASIVANERDRLQSALETGDLDSIIARYPIRETNCLAEIARKLGFQGREQYEGAVRKLLMDDPESVRLVRSFFDGLSEDIDAA